MVRSRKHGLRQLAAPTGVAEPGAPGLRGIAVVRTQRAGDLMSETNEETHVVIVGGGFAGVACAKRLAGEQRTRVTLLDKTGYHQFQPLLYQVATAELTPTGHVVRAWPRCSRHEPSVDVRTPRWPRSTCRTARVTLADGEHGRRRRAGARGRRAAQLLPHAGRGGVRVPALQPRRRAADPGAHPAALRRRGAASPSWSTQGALTFVVVGAGPTGVETAGALAELVARRDAARATNTWPSTAPR